MTWLSSQLLCSPLSGRFAHAQLCPPDHSERGDVERFIAAIYRARFDAQLTNFLPHLVAYRDTAGQLLAAVGLRSAAEGPLFLEQYLDEPIEHALRRTQHAPVNRYRIAEAGNFATQTPGVARELIVQLAWLLRAAGMDWVTFVATRQLRNAFDRMELAPVELATARAERLDGQGRQWGSYYDTQPRVMCGNLLQGVEFLRARTGQAKQDPEMALCCAGGET